MTASAIAGSILAAIVPWARPEEGTRVDPLGRDALVATVRHLASDALEGRGPGSSGHRQAREWIVDALRRIGCQPPHADEARFAFPFESLAGDGVNVLAVLPGSDPERREEYVVVSAHYDHLGRGEDGTVYNGADDDASGVAALLGIAAAMAPADARPARSLLFAVTDLEERGLWGALALTADGPVPTDRWVANVNLEVLGNELVPGIDRLLTVTGAECDATGVIRAAAREAANETDVALRFLTDDLLGPRGDHHAFLLHGVPAVMVAAGTTATYHSPLDDPDTLEPGKLEASARFARGLVERLADGAEIPQYEAPTPGPSPEDAGVVAEFLESLLVDGGGPTAPRLREEWISWRDRLREIGTKDALDDEERSLVQGVLYRVLGWIVGGGGAEPVDSR